jgi:hypothetical protein
MVGAAPTTTGRTGTARRCGSGKRDGKPYVRNQCPTPRNISTGSNLADMGRVQCTPPDLGGDFEAGLARRWEGHGESLRRRRGDAAGVQLDGSPVDRWVVNVGSGLASPCAPSGAGQVRRRLTMPGRGGGPVVVRARERRVHGEEGQQVGSGRAGIPGGRR